MWQKVYCFLKQYKFYIDLLIISLISFVCAYFIFNKFIKLNFMLDDIDYLTGLTYRRNYFDYIYRLGMRAISFRPISLGLYWIVTFKSFGLNPYSYHLFNIIMHSINSTLIYILIALSFRKKLVAFIASFFYLIHPVHVEALTWITAGFTSQSVVLFSCITLITYYLYLKKNKKIFIVSSYLSFTCAFLSREDAVVFPILIVVFLFFIGKVNRRRAREIFVYLVIAVVIMTIRYLLLYPKVFVFYSWNFKDISNAVHNNNYYLSIAFSPIKKLFGEVVLFKNKYMKTFSYPLLLLTVYVVFKNRKTNEIKLLSFGLIWYAICSIPFNFMVGDNHRYLSMSIVGILIVQGTIIWMYFNWIRNFSINFARIIFLCFIVVMFLICKYMAIEEFTKNAYTKPNTLTQYYIAKINTAIKEHPDIKNIKLVNFPRVIRLLELLKLYPEYKDINFIYAEKYIIDAERNALIFEYDSRTMLIKRF